MRKVNVHEAKTTLSKLIDAVESGEEVILSRAGRPVAKLVKLDRKRGIKLGVLKGKIPGRLLEAVATPLSKREADRLFGGSIEP